MRSGISLVIGLAIAFTVACGSGGPTTPVAAPAVPASTSVAVPGSSASGQASVLNGGGPNEKQRREIKVAAASDLRRAMTELQPTIEQACDTKLTFVFGSSGQLKEQILAGADYHLYLSADTGFVEELERAGKLVPNGRATYAVGRIVLAWRMGLPPLTSTADLTRADIKRVAIANPAHAPYGRAAEQAMNTVGVWAGLQRRLVLGENIRQTTDYVQQGNVDAAIVALALVIDTDTPYVLIESTQHKPIIQGGGVVKDTGGEVTGRCALQTILNPVGQGTLKRFGFEPAPAP